MAIEYNFTLDMDRSKRDNNIAYARTGDVDSITINADLVLNGAAYTPTGTNAFFECVTPNGHSVRAAAEKTGSSVSVEVPSAAFQAAGVINVAYFRFETGEADNPTYVESTEPFAIVVREGIGDNVDAGDYIEEWRGLADQLEAAVAEVEKNAEQAKTAINEQKTEVDQLKAQAQTAIAGDVTEVEAAAQSAITAIDQEKADVANAAEGITEAGEQAINTFNTNSQQAIDSFNTNSQQAISKFNTDSASAISQFNSNGTSAIDQFNSKGTTAIGQFNTNADDKLGEVDDMITEAQGDVDAAVTQLKTATDQAVSAMEDALDGTTAGSLQNAINRTLKLDVADMTDIASNSSLSSFTNVGSYCCKTAATAATIGDCPIDDSPFNMYVFSSSASGQVMQLVVPIDLQGKPTAEWHVRFGTSSAMDPWSVIGGGADISAGLGIDVTGDAQKTVALDTTAFYQHHEAASVIQGSTEVTGGGRVKELTVYGATRQNLWVNPNITVSGITAKANADGSVTLSGTATGVVNLHSNASYNLRPGSTYYMSCSPEPDGFYIGITQYVDGAFKSTKSMPTGGGKITIDSDVTHVTCVIYGIASGKTVSGTYRVMLNEGDTAEPWCPPGINGVDELSIVTAGKNFALTEFNDAVSSGITFNTESDGSISVVGTATSTYQQRSKVMNLPSNTDMVVSKTVTGDVGSGGYCYFIVYGVRDSKQKTLVSTRNADEAAFNTGEYDYWTFATVAEGNGVTFDCKLYPQLELGSTATPYEPHAVTTTPIDLDGHTLNSLPDGTRDELRIEPGGTAVITKRVGSVEIPGDASGMSWEASGSRAYFDLPSAMSSGGADQSGTILCDVLQPRKGNDETYIIASSTDGRAYVKIAGTTSATDVAGKVGGGTLLYPLAEPVEVELPDVVMPDLASPSYTVYASSNVPAEIEAEVVKVDYLPASDVYTKQEVDQKIEASGMPDIMPVSKGGTGATDDATARTNLGITPANIGAAAAGHTHSAVDITSGTLPVARGGTGVTTEDAVAQMVFTHAPEASPTQAGVVKTLSDQDFCEYMGIDYNPEDWS